MIPLDTFRNMYDACCYVIGNVSGVHTMDEAKKYVRAHIPKENYYQTKIMDRIQQLVPDAFIWKAAAGPYTRQGIPDICAVINGKYYGFEVKRPLVGKASTMQVLTIRKIQTAGGYAYIVHTPDEVAQILRENGEVK